ncbi:mono/diheme cytochrome c family protein [Breoghania corrubedonensis]|uniref:Mono/diheme cytochrome c family protein n=1 Tax=Breoghania corrubedonensis TaxID=665038 RepID=A0A2T5V9V3_9HYPH|nr:cytochrome c [Breoghania corrubedonensis]PTW60539.1 mono/diheme cytochrome c family protein [Breoghania corrubedonensis]
MKKALAILLVVLVIAAAIVAWFVTRLPSSPFDGQPRAEISNDLVARGEYVARLADCVACHSTPDSAPFAGGLEMATPLGSIFTTNITPDPQTGIGNYTLADFDRAVRQGVTPDGARLYPAMPYPSYVKLSDEDVRALYAFFMKGVEPVRMANRANTIEWPLNTRWPLAFWNVAFVESGRYEPESDKDDLWNRGAYLVQAAGHCGSCHTPRGPVMQEKALDETNGNYLSGALLDGWYAPSLRNDHNTGLGRWSEDEVVQFLKKGRNAHGVVFGSMTDAFNNSTQFMNDDDLAAIAHYLKSLPGDRERDGTPWQYDAASNEKLALSNRTDNPGARIFMAKCGACHAADGRGKTPWIPPLAGTTSSLAPQNASSVNVTLNGSGRVVTDGVPDSYRMPPFREQLSDKEIAAVLTFVRTSWGNTGGPVTSQEVRDLRERTDPASSNPIVLQMR